MTTIQGVRALAIGLLLFSLSSQTFADQAKEGSASRLEAWKRALSSCSVKADEGNLQFVWIFDGLWPIPLDFNLTASDGDGVQYVPMLVKGSGPDSLAKIHIGTEQDFSANWSADVARFTTHRSSSNGFSVEIGAFRHPEIRDYQASFAVIRKGKHYVLLYGAVSEYWPEFIACFKKASRSLRSEG